MEKFQEQREDDHDQVYEAEEPEPRYVFWQFKYALSTTQNYSSLNTQNHELFSYVKNTKMPADATTHHTNVVTSRIVHHWRRHRMTFHSFVLYSYIVFVYDSYDCLQLLENLFKKVFCFPFVCSRLA